MMLIGNRSAAAAMMFLGCWILPVVEVGGGGVTSSFSTTATSTITAEGQVQSSPSNGTDFRPTQTLVMVHIPFHLHNASGNAHIPAEFGFPTPEGSISEYLYYLDSTLCAPIYDKTVGYPANNMSADSINFRPFLLMVNRGDCSFVTKARFAQQYGAAALLVRSIRCLCTDDPCLAQHPNRSCETQPPVLADDGSGSDVSIPTFLLNRLTSDHIIDEVMNKSQPVLMEVTWGLKETSQDSLRPIDVHLWTSGHDPILDLDTYYNLRTVVTAFKDHIMFSPRLAVVDGARFHCLHQPEDDGPCDHLCTNQGRYCALHARDLTGRAIIKETLRRICIWKHYGESDPKLSTAWFDYIIYHREHCMADPHSYADEDCIDQAYHQAKIKRSVIEGCMTDSGGLANDTINTLLDEMLMHQAKSGVVRLPALIAGNHILEQASTWSLFEAICGHYWRSNAPSIPDMCLTCGSCPNKVGCLAKGKCVAFHEDQHHTDPATSGQDPKKQRRRRRRRRRGWTVFFWLLVLAGLAAGGWYYYRQRLEYGARAGLLDGYFQLGMTEQG